MSWEIVSNLYSSMSILTTPTSIVSHAMWSMFCLEESRIFLGSPLYKASIDLTLSTELPLDSRNFLITSVSTGCSYWGACSECNDLLFTRNHNRKNMSGALLKGGHRAKGLFSYPKGPTTFSQKGWLHHFHPSPYLEAYTDNIAACN